MSISEQIRIWLSKLSFRTGVAVLAICALCYVISFAQMALPIPLSVKSVLWIIFFGMAKTAQYAAILILGKDGIGRLKKFVRRYRNDTSRDQR